MFASRLHWRLLIGTILALMAAAWIAPIWIKPPDIQENRILAAKPEWPKRVREFGQFRKNADAYVADHFPIRPQLIGALNRVRMLFGVSGSKKVIIGRDGWLFFDDDTHLGGSRNDPPMTRPEIRDWLSHLAGRTEMLRARGIPYLVVAMPVKETIYPQFAPAWYRPTDDRATLRLPKLAAEAGVGDILYLHPYVAAATRAGQKTYSRHDTHWTGYGAYAGYVGLMQRLHAMGLTDEAKPLSAFDVLPQTANRPRDMALMLGVASFVDVDFQHIGDPNGGGRLKVDYLTDKTDWTAPQVVETGEVGKPVLMMTRDSFSNELLPFLYSHFSRIILAHNQDGSWRPDLVERFKPDIVLLEVVEHGLRVSMGDGPAGSPGAMTRIDGVLTAEHVGETAGVALRAPDAKTLQALAAAKAAKRCTVDIAKLAPAEQGGGVTLTVAGWISELGFFNTPREALVRLRGPNLDLVAPTRVALKRPDVAKAFHNPVAGDSGYALEVPMTNPQPGAYRVTVYRRSRSGWISCEALQNLTWPPR